MYAVVQYKPRRGARNSNLAGLATLAAQALQGGAKVLVLPEMAATGYRFPNPEAIRPMSEAPRGPTFRTFAPLARQYKAHVVVGFVEDHEGRLFNSALVINAEGRLEALYRKRLLYIDDHTWASPGDLPYPQFTTPYGTATVGICMDINDPRFITHIRRTRPDIVCFPTNWVDEGIDIQKYWATQLRGWNGTLVAADRWGEEDGVGFAGRSAVMRRGETIVSGPAEGDGWWAAPFVKEPAAAAVPKKEVAVVAATPEEAPAPTPPARTSEAE
ncbi:MAG: carbon-nitrogen hydrolase family protein [Myxococcota bacterium]